MSLYYEAADALLQQGDIKSFIFNNKNFRSPPTQIYALAIETLKSSSILAEVVENARLLRQERSLKPVLSLLLVHDLLLTKDGIALPTLHPLKQACLGHKARLIAEMTRARLRRGFHNIEALKESLRAGPKRSQEKANHPRWVRINTVRTTLADQLKTTFAGYTPVTSINSILISRSVPPAKIYHIDRHVRSLLAFPAGTDLSLALAYKAGHIIFQDKASCFPALLLSPDLDSGDILDACAAPGNKTTHLASFLSEACEGTVQRGRQKIIACERDEQRSLTLRKMIEWAGASDIVSIKAGHDFLDLEPIDERWRDVGALLLDPSCSGSGIIGRDDEVRSLTVPRTDIPILEKRKGKKRKRKTKAEEKVPDVARVEDKLEKKEEHDQLNERLMALSAFQLKLLLHAFRFPAARKVVYSTCSIYTEENEGVVMKALNSNVAIERGWRIMRREEQVDGLREWNVRGDVKACEGVVWQEKGEVVADACIRCIKGDEEGTMGFFVAGFVRGEHGARPEDIQSEEEWHGFSEGDGDMSDSYQLKQGD
ncbi:MAG: hypothetical protein M1835_006044 [Candelina submexicana]|nr:MAG: hypothetical protein M1835_006044 [Candelina submexicana]